MVKEPTKKTSNVYPARTIPIKEKQGRGTVYLVLARSSLLCLGLFLKTVSVSLEFFFSVILPWPLFYSKFSALFYLSQLYFSEFLGFSSFRPYLLRLFSGSSFLLDFLGYPNRNFVVQ